MHTVELLSSSSLTGGDDVDDSIDDDDHDIDGDIVDEDTIQFLKNIFLLPLSGDHLHSSAA